MYSIDPATNSVTGFCWRWNNTQKMDVLINKIVILETITLIYKVGILFKFGFFCHQIETNKKKLVDTMLSMNHTYVDTIHLIPKCLHCTKIYQLKCWSIGKWQSWWLVKDVEYFLAFDSFSRVITFVSVCVFFCKIIIGSNVL